jgi:hypothetical protein
LAPRRDLISIRLDLCLQSIKRWSMSLNVLWDCEDSNCQLWENWQLPCPPEH